MIRPQHLGISHDASERHASYRQIFPDQLDDAAVADIPLALNQRLPPGNSRSRAEIAHAGGKRRDAQARSTDKGTADGK